MERDIRKLNDGFKRTGSWVAGVTLALAALPFVWGAGYMSYRSLWFQHAAPRAEGTVVNVTSGTPELTVEFRTADGQTRHTESGGSDLYKGYQAGDKITVFYDPQHPADARLDLWVENWLLPLITAVPGAIILLAMFLIVRGLRSDPFGKAEFDTGGTLVPAEFVRARLSPNMDWDVERAPGDFTLTEKDGRWQLKHNGVERDPYDLRVQRELGLCWILEAKGKDPGTGAERLFESEPLDSDPTHLAQGRPVPVYVDPKNPQVYRMELPFRKKPQSKAQSASPITKL